MGPRGPTHCSARPTVRHSESGPLSLSVRECGSAGFTSARTACAIRPTLRQSQSRHSHASPLHPGARLLPSYQSGRMFIFHPLGVGPPSPFDSLSALVVRGGAVCPPMPPSWFPSKCSLYLLCSLYLDLNYNHCPDQCGLLGGHRPTRQKFASSVPVWPHAWAVVWFS